MGQRRLLTRLAKCLGLYLMGACISAWESPWAIRSLFEICPSCKSASELCLDTREWKLYKLVDIMRTSKLLALLILIFIKESTCSYHGSKRANFKARYGVSCGEVMF